MSVRPFKKTIITVKGAVFLTLLLSVFLGGWILGTHTRADRLTVHQNFSYPFLSKTELAEKIGKLGDLIPFELTDPEVSLEGFSEPAVLEYSFDPDLQNSVEELLNRYKPDLGVVVAMDATTGRVLAMKGINRAFEIERDPSFQTLYTSASIFKVVTATAALQDGNMTPSSRVTFSGRSHTLYRRQVLNERVRGWRRVYSFKQAFARSFNPVFGRIGVFLVGEDPLQDFSTRFGFNEPIPSEFTITESLSAQPKNQFEVAEMASGFTQNNVITPVHGALIAAAVANGGVMMEPYFVNRAYLKSGRPIYQAEPTVLSKVMDVDVADSMKSLMRETVVSGTSRKSFRGFFRGKFNHLEVGGKTGHLTDRNHNGSTDWFVGYAESGGRKIAISVLTMNKKYWTVKSSYLARRAIELAFEDKKVAKN